MFVEYKFDLIERFHGILNVDDVLAISVHFGNEDEKRIGVAVCFKPTHAKTMFFATRTLQEAYDIISYFKMAISGE